MSERLRNDLILSSVCNLQYIFNSIHISAIYNNNNPTSRLPRGNGGEKSVHSIKDEPATAESKLHYQVSNDLRLPLLCKLW